MKSSVWIEHLEAIWWFNILYFQIHIYSDKNHHKPIIIKTHKNNIDNHNAQAKMYNLQNWWEKCRQEQRQVRLLEPSRKGGERLGKEKKEKQPQAILRFLVATIPLFRPSTFTCSNL